MPPHDLPSRLLRGLGAALTVALFLSSSLGAETGAPVPPFEAREVAPGVWAVLQPQAQWFNDSNSVIVDLGDELLVVDSQANRNHVNRVVDWIRDERKKPVRLLVNTHWHSDHTQGNQIYREAFGEELRILGHATLGTDVPQRAGGYLAEQKERYLEAIPEAEERLRQGVDRDGKPLEEEGKKTLAEQIERARQTLAGFDEVRWQVPDLAFHRRLDIHRGGRRVELHHFQAHTRGDTVIYLPEEKVLVTGDLLDAIPYGGHGYPTPWIATLKTLAKLDFETIVPGHGPVFHGREQLQRILSLVESVVSQVKVAVADGLDLEATQKAVDLSAFRQLLAGDDAVAQRNFDHFMPETIARAWKEARGELE